MSTPMKQPEVNALMLMAILNQGDPAAQHREFPAPRPTRKVRARMNNPAKCLCGTGSGFCKRHRVYVSEGGKDR